MSSSGQRFDGEARQMLLLLARRTIALQLGLPAPPEPVALPAVLLVPGAAFVTLQLAGELRGCIGTLEAREPLVDCVRRQSGHAAFEDPRFAPLTVHEWPGVTIELTVLGPSRKITGPAEFIPGTHGIIIEQGHRRAVFLPQVATEQGWNREETLTHLARKAGLPASAWRHEARLAIFEAEHFSETSLPPR
jgi:AmmeMemoRadiSam system protein A